MINGIDVKKAPKGGFCFDLARASLFWEGIWMSNRLLPSAVICSAFLFASTAGALPMSCHFDRECAGGGECTPADVTVTLSGTQGAVDMRLPDLDAPGQGRANTMGDGRILINAMFGMEATVMLNLRADGTADVLISTLSGTQPLFGTCRATP